MDEVLQSIAAKLASALPGAASDEAFAFGELTVTVDAARILDVLTWLRDDPAAQFVSIIDISGADYPEREKRFDVCYHLLSPKLNRRIRLLGVRVGALVRRDAAAGAAAPVDTKLFD